MTKIKKVLIVCDTYDCIKYNSINKGILKQLYVLVYLLNKYFAEGDRTIQICNNSFFGFDVFWEEKTPMQEFLSPYLFQKEWKELDFLNYDLIITHPANQQILQSLIVLKHTIFDYSRIYSILDLDFDREMLFSSIGTLFTKDGLLALNEKQKKDPELATFKQEFDKTICEFNRSRQESLIPDLSIIIENFNRRLVLDKIKSVLILELYDKNNYIGDAVDWFPRIKKIFALFEEKCEIRLNIANSAAASTISTIFHGFLKDGKTITNDHWDEISFGDYDLILINSDITAKFYAYYRKNDASFFNNNLFFTYTIDDASDVKEGQQTFDFITNIKRKGFNGRLEIADKKYRDRLFNEISLLKTEVDFAEEWLVGKGIQKTDKLIGILHGASGFAKVINELEKLKLIKKLCNVSGSVKVLLVCNRENEAKWIAGALDEVERKKLVLLSDLELRSVMSILANSRFSIIIGPCTGLMHASNDLYRYLLNHKIIDLDKVPVLLTYTGKQPQVYNYTPQFWWKDSDLTHCCVFYKPTGSEGEECLISLDESPDTPASFYQDSRCVFDIKHEMLLNYIIDRLSNPLRRLGIDFSHILTPNCKEIKSLEKTIPTYIINLKERFDRRANIEIQFSGKHEFNWTIIEAVKHKFGNLGLWYTVKHIIESALEKDYDYILICEDDHEFTSHYSKESLFAAIENALELRSDILLGGVGGLNGEVKLVYKDLISVDGFACTQFMVLFKEFYTKLLKIEFAATDCIDLKFSEVSERKLVIYPYISIQKDFGYSDVTSGYYEDKMQNCFLSTSKLIQTALIDKLTPIVI
ncbi:MAG: hypothetical protein K0S24_1898 [Sphingobacterium sp.]|jgi:ADP-heptose:LPS heptosyltransferase|nr:hypothetical protein [Sphingobacterium sp.]